MGKLITFSPSADCELARWILQYYGENYIEDKHTMPFVLIPLKLNGSDTFPLYVNNELKLTNVRAIIDHFETATEENKKLIPAKYANEIETDWTNFNAKLGSNVVTWAYSNLLPHRQIMTRPLSLGCPWYEEFVVKHFYNLPKNTIWNSADLSKPNADMALITIKKIFSDVGKMLSKGSKYLYGEQITLADMAFAVSGAPLVLPAGYGGNQYEQGAIPTFEEFPEELQEIISKMRQTPAGKFILRLYAEDRYPS